MTKRNEKRAKSGEIWLANHNIKLNHQFLSICSLKIAFNCVKFGVLLEIYLQKRTHENFFSTFGVNDVNEILMSNILKTYLLTFK